MCWLVGLLLSVLFACHSCVCGFIVCVGLLLWFCCFALLRGFCVCLVLIGFDCLVAWVLFVHVNSVVVIWVFMVWFIYFCLIVM